MKHDQTKPPGRGELVPFRPRHPAVPTNARSGRSGAGPPPPEIVIIPPESPLKWFELQAPDEPLEPLVCADVWQALHSAAGVAGTDLIAEVRVSCGDVRVCVGCRRARAEEIVRAIRGAAPDWEVAETVPPLPPAGHARIASLLRRQTPLDWAPLRAMGVHEAGDPLTPVLEAVQPLAADEQMVIRWVVRLARAGRTEQARHGLSVPAPKTATDLVFTAFDLGPRGPRFDNPLQRDLERRLEERAFEVIAAVALAGSQEARLTSRARSLSAAYHRKFDAGFGGLTLSNWSRRVGPDNFPAAGRDDAALMYMTAGEMAAVWHPLSGEVRVPGVRHARRRHGSLPPQMADTRGLLLGLHFQRGEYVPVLLPRADLEAGHMAVIGRTGQGKTTLIQRVLTAPLLASDRPGVGVLDPHGDLVNDIAARSIPAGREGDVALLDLGDVEYPVSLPLFARPVGVTLQVHIESIFNIIRILFREEWSATRMEDLIYAIVVVLCTLLRATLLDVTRLLDEPTFRRAALSHCDDPVALQFWSGYEQLTPRAQQEMCRPVLYRLRKLYRSPALRNLLCQTEGIDLGRLMDTHKIVLVSLSGAAIQAEADLLGELLITRMHMAALSRLDRPRDQRPPFYLAVDESQRFGSGSLPALLREGRKMGISLVLATQYLNAWGENLEESVLGTVGTIVAFRSGPDDARRLKATIRPFAPEDLEDLNRFEAIVKMQANGQTLPAFDVRTVDIPTERDEARLARLRRLSRERYARPRADVEIETLRRPERPSQTRQGNQYAQDIFEE